METLRPNGQRAKNAITLIWIMFALEIISVISGYFEYDLRQDMANGADIPGDAIDANYTWQLVIALVYLLAYIISAVTFIQWFRRAYFNLHRKVAYLRWGEGWAAGSWFVPILNLFRPYQIMKELYTETKNLLTENGVSMGQNLSTGLLGWWWTLWIINSVISQTTFRINEPTTATIVNMIVSITGIPLALLAVRIIYNYSEVEPLLNEISEEDKISSLLVTPEEEKAL